MAVPSNISVPSTAPQDVAGLALYLTVLMQQLNNWIALAAQQLNSTQGYRFAVNSQGQLTVVSPNGTVTLLSNP